jgi:hypothetical protein
MTRPLVITDVIGAFRIVGMRHWQEIMQCKENQSILHLSFGHLQHNDSALAVVATAGALK